MIQIPHSARDIRFTHHRLSSDRQILKTIRLHFLYSMHFVCDLCITKFKCWCCYTYYFVLTTLNIYIKIIMSTPETKKSPVRRRLFPEESANNALPKEEPFIKFDAEKLEEERRIARERWNFDFETETPLEGNWEWEEVKPDVLQIGPRERQQRLSDEIERVQSEQDQDDIHSL